MTTAHGTSAMVLSLGLLTIEANHTLLRRSKKARRPPSRPVAMNVGVGACNVGLVVWRLAKYSEAVGECSARHRNIRGTGEVSVYTNRSGDGHSGSGLHRPGSTPKAGRSVSEAELIEFCRDQIAHFKMAAAVEFGELSKTSTGKIQKSCAIGSGRARARGSTDDADGVGGRHRRRPGPYFHPKTCQKGPTVRRRGLRARSVRRRL